jgi:predicted RNA binding protein YcfA (HicA-like mRNA interferase family)
MSYTAKQLIRAAKKLGYAVKEGGKHTLIYDPTSGRRISTIPRGNIPKGTFNAILIANGKEMVNIGLKDKKASNSSIANPL